MATDPLLNKLFDGRYLILRRLGSGGMADVYLAEDQELGRRVALKLLNDRHANDDQFVERFRREAQSAAGLNHPNIVSIFDRGQAEGTYYIAMKHLTAVPDPPSKLRPDIPHDLDAIVMRALAKDPEQRYGSAEEMDADLARVARGVAVSQKTEEAMTQVLAGDGATTAATMITRPRTVTTPPAYRPPAYYEEAPRRRSVWPWLLGILACAIAAVGGYLLYQKIQDQLRHTAPVAVVDVRNILENLARHKLKAQGFDVRTE